MTEEYLIIPKKHLSARPCKRWFEKFSKNGRFLTFKQVSDLIKQESDGMWLSYTWFFKHSIGDVFERFVQWQIENNEFDWNKDSAVIIMYVPHLINEHQYNFKQYSYLFPILRPELIKTYSHRIDWSAWVVNLTKQHSSWMQTN